MKIICPVADLCCQLEKLALTSSPKYAEVLGHVLIDANAEIKLTTTDLSISMTTSVVGQIVEPGKALLPCKQLLNLLKVLSADEVILEAVGDSCLVQTTTGKYKLDTLPVADFPAVPIVIGGEFYKFTAKQLIEGIKTTLYSASTDETKMVLCGVNLQIANGNLSFVGLDGYRLTLIEIEDDHSNHSSDFTISNQTCFLLLKLLAKVNSGVEVFIDGLKISFSFDGLRITSRLLGGDYPKYRQLIPKQFDKKVTVDRVALIDAVEKIQVISEQKDNGIYFEPNLACQEITLISQVTDVGHIKLSLPAQIQGDDIKTGFYCPYLLDALKNLASSEVQIYLNATLTPVIIEPLNVQRIKCLVMPLQIKD